MFSIKFLALFLSYHFLTEPSSNGGKGGLIYTHKLARGTIESSAVKMYGIELAKTTSMPKEVIAQAKLIAEELMKGRKVSFHRIIIRTV